MKRKYHFKLVIVALTIFLPLAVFSQCKVIAKKQCMPKIAPYTHNGQINSTALVAGQTAELQMTFNSGMEYRILVCAQEVLGKARFKLIDVDKNTVFDSQEAKFPEYWDFKVGTTQQFTLEVNVPESNSPNAMVQSGCVSVLVGFK